MATRREELAEAATDYAIEHGLIGLSLRPLARRWAPATGCCSTTSATRTTWSRRSCARRASRSVREHPCPAAVARPARRRPRPLASRVHRPLQACQRLYVEAASLGLFGHEPYATEVREANAAVGAGGRGHLRGASG